MDAYDQYRQSGEHGETFDKFGEPRDYWVRSTRQRPNQVYPTKPLIGFARSKTELNGGWGQKGDAAAQLHNSGYIIVDKDDDPVEPPERYDHLVRDADRIRFCALNYYIKPSRERREEQVSIRAGTLADDLFLGNRMRNVCQALKGEKFQKLANVSPPTQTGANDSTTTTFTFDLFDHEKRPAMDSNAYDHNQTATNLILYGPPGTGKTYTTALEAVRLCVGNDAGVTLRNDRNALMAEYRRLMREGRIEFVTFHQSFSYEDFVEGLRPTTETKMADDEHGDNVASGGFSLKAHPGVFKVISERARLDTGNAVTKRLDRSRTIYKIALGQRWDQEDQICEALDQSLIHIGWGGEVDWSDDRFDDFEEIRKEWNAKKDPDATGKDPNIEMMFAFRSGLQVGDYVVISDGRDSFRALGKVTGEYEFDPTASFHPHRRKVEWVWRDDNGADRAAFYPNNFRRHSTYRLNRNLIDWDALETVVIDPNAERPVAGARPHVLIIDEINRANISKVFGELITLLEVDKRLGCENEVRVRLPYSGTNFGVPSNLHVIGTMNTADRSIALLDTALRRRFAFRELMPDVTELRNAMGARKLDVENLDGVNLSKLLTTINERIEYLFDRDHQIGHAYFTECRSRADVEEVLRHKVIPLLAEYFYEDWSKVAAVLGDGSGAAKAHFLEAKKLSPPAEFSDDELGGEKLRWSVKAEFDFSEFEA
ncbi:MAG: AAA family ATPase [Alphaproteobacteria bacterium]|nr:AAA family ATPase [Alphaproteobacteria bacterium]